MFYMITPFVEPSDAVLQSIVDVEALIEGVILRLDGRDDEMDVVIMQLKRLIDPSKIIVHNTPHLMMKHGLTRIHFKECAGEAIAFKQQHPEFCVGMSVHSEDSVRLIDGVLDYYIFGHVFSTPSKPGLTPQSASVIDTVLSYKLIKVDNVIAHLLKDGRIIIYDVYSSEEAKSVISNLFSISV